jgi:hypothetical protein
MTDLQILTVGLTVLLPLTALIYSNSRITEAKETLRAEMQTLRVEMNAGFQRLENKIDHLADEVAALKA